ncbi:MAG: Zn-dependent hydrolase [Bacteroidetes bacterium]|nr:Zn-dependent hydrolase [Bacteroidota bacterium]
MNKALFISFLIQLYSAQTLIGQPKITANPDRMEKRILALSAFGANPQGGVSRLGFSDADIEARKFMINLMEQAGLEVRIDAGGNIIGKRKGKNSNLPVILFGSHIDSVPEGGNYDGDVGVIGALECIELLNEHNITTEHPLEMVIFSDEEGGLTGSQAMIGTLHADDLNRISNSGKTVGQGINDIGGNTTQLNMAKRSKREIAAFLELHIEQGAILYEENVNIGVVEGIVGIEQWEITVTGKANHAGTTPMNNRQDALIAASKLVLAVNEIIRSVPGTQVGTVGVISAEPGAPNVIPGKVKMMLEMRELSRDKMLSLHKQIRSQALLIADESGTTINFRSLNLDIYPALADDTIQDLISQSAQDLGLSFQYMPSFAGHDAQDMAKITSMGMIFVPSKQGVSHSPQEFTSSQDMANGASVLFHSILKVDRLKKK